MDPVTALGVAAGALQIFQAIAILTVKAAETCSRLHNAPKELTDVVAALTVLQLELKHITSITTEKDGVWTMELRLDFEEALIEAREGVLVIDELVKKSQARSCIDFRTHWVFQDRKTTLKAMNRLQRARDHLDIMLRVLTTNATTTLHQDVRDVKRLLQTKVQSLSATNDESSTDQRPKLPRPDRRLDGLPSSTGVSWAVVGVRGHSIPTRQKANKDYLIALRLENPMVRILGSYAFMMAISVRTFPLCPRSYQILNGSSLFLARSVCRNSPFIVACQTGDLLAIRHMLQSGEGRPTDIDDRNLTPLACAISSGSVPAVVELLDNGADINFPLGKLQTNPLQWAIWNRQLDVVRELLSRGASQDHVNLWGWNVAFFCWPQLSFTDRSMMKYMNLLAEDAYQDLDVADQRNWTVLHRVAAFGAPEDVLGLIKLGADPGQVALPLRWNAIHHAVFYGNVGAFDVLVKHFQDDLVTMVDERGWTLLHIAASAGHEEITQKLLIVGANPGARSRPFVSHMPEILFRRACTPREVAAAQGMEREGRYLDILDKLDLLDPDEANDEYFDAEEVAEVDQME